MTACQKARTPRGLRRPCNLKSAPHFVRSVTEPACVPVAVACQCNSDDLRHPSHWQRSRSNFKLQQHRDHDEATSELASGSFNHWHDLNFIGPASST
eukprot:2689598-Rhodomonas_salina.2